MVDNARRPYKHQRRVRRGDLITARGLTQVREAVNQIVGDVNPPQQRFGKAVSNPGRSKRFKVVEVKGDYLVCNAFNGQVTGTQKITVAKPWLLRRSPFDGESRDSITYTYSSDTERQADDGSNTEDQVVVPSYVVDDEIYAEFDPEGGSGVTVTLPDNTEVAAMWLDTNRDGRAWAKKAT